MSKTNFTAKLNLSDPNGYVTCFARHDPGGPDSVNLYVFLDNSNVFCDTEIATRKPFKQVTLSVAGIISGILDVEFTEVLLELSRVSAALDAWKAEL